MMYSLELLEDIGLLGCKPDNTRVEINNKLSHSSSDSLIEATPYMRLIRRLIYLTITRLNLTYVVSMLSEFMDIPY